MASYTDQIPKFNPYIQQLPIEAMVQVGMEKQRRYDEGLQKIQTNIDNVAGLDVVRDVDKQYLQSKLNDLGSKLKTVAAGDFSNYQLVNSVGGMAKQIGKDTTIQNAVSSTNAYRRGMTDMQNAQKEGKSSPSNDAIFKQEVGKWLNNGDVESSFSGSYTPYTNNKKNALEVIKQLTKNSNITEEAFKIDSKGNLVITDAVVRKQMAGISPETIQQALMVGLTPADFKQMEIDGRYNYSNISDDKFIQSINNSYKSKEASYTAQKEEILAAISQTSSNIEKNTLKDQVGSIDKMLANMKNEYESVTSTFAKGDVESAKAKLETINFINGFSKAFSFTETSNTYEKSELADMQMRREVKNQDWKIAVMNLEQDERKMKQDYALSMLDIETKREANRLKAEGDAGYGGIGGPRDVSEIPQYNLARVVGEIEQGEKAINISDRTFLQQQGKDQAWLDLQKVAWDKNPNGVDPLISAHFNDTESQRRILDANQIMIGDINKLASKQIDPSTGKPYGSITDLIPRNAPNINVNTPSASYSFSPKDFVDFNQTYKKYIKYTTRKAGVPGTGGTIVSFKDEEALRDLSPKELVLYNTLKKREKKGDMNSSEKVLVDNLLNYNKIVNQPFSAKVSAINDFTAKEVTRRLTASQAMDYEIPTGTEAQRSSFGTILTTFANIAEKQKGGIANSPDFDVAIARAIAIDPKLTGTITVVEGSEIEPAMYELSYTGEAGSGKVRMTPEQKRSAFGNRFDSSPAVQMVKPYLEQMRKMGGSSTAYSPGQSSHTNSFLTSIDFPSVSMYGVKANIVKSNGGYSIRISGFDPETKQWQDNLAYPRTGLLSEGRIAEALINLNDAAMYELINDKAPTSADLNRVKSASKKPL
jgi:hypothetical protein